MRVGAVKNGPVQLGNQEPVLPQGLSISPGLLRTSVVTPKPANGGQGKTGQRKGPGTKLFYPAACC